jgi:RimJ/RimL family protein N-acetyltransferase
MPLFDFSTFPIIETERLVLRQITHADVPALFNIYGDAETMRYYAPPYTTIEESHDDVQLHKRRFREKTGIRWGITLKGSALKGSDTLIGNCGYNPRVYGNRSDIGYMAFISLKLTASKHRYSPATPRQVSLQKNLVSPMKAHCAATCSGKI